MRQISLREFRIRGAKALKAVPQGETVLLSGQQGPAYFLVRFLGMWLWKTGNCDEPWQRPACAKVGSMPKRPVWTG